MTNTILDAIQVYSQLETKQLGDVYSSSISINQTGERLEYFVKDLISDSFDADTKEEKDARHSEQFSWTGAQNHPPDIMIRGGEAIEVKKSKGKHPSLALNSSPPRQTISSDTMRITNECRECEDDIGGWTDKDLVYVIGSRVSKNNLGFMWMVYGDCWCAPDESYLTISDTITSRAAAGLQDIDHIKMDTGNNEIGKIHSADPLGRTKLRIRGMWSLSHPAKYFSQYVTDYEEKINSGQPLFVVMRRSRFEQFSGGKRAELWDNSRINITDIDVPEPSNPEESISCLLIETP